jgi:hypothetical protein
MLKQLSGFILLVFLLTACNFASEPTVIAPTVDVVGTQVAQTLAVVPTTPDKPIVNLTVTQVTPTLQSTHPLTATAVPTLTSTLSPTLDPKISPTRTATFTRTVAGPTQTPSKAPTNTPTSTAVAGDPRNALGTPTWKDDFQKASTWGLGAPYDDGHTRVSIAPGKIVLTSKNAEGWPGWRMQVAKIQNFYLEATINTLNCADTDMYGLAFRSSSTYTAYWFEITCDGRYSLESGDMNNATEIIKLKANPLIKAGSNQTNRFGVFANGNKLSFYANGKLLEEITNTNIPDAGIFGYFVLGKKTANFTIESTEIAYWKLP